MTFHVAGFNWNDGFEELCDTESTSSDTVSELSDGEDLKADFEDALSGNLNSTGKYFYCYADPSAPNPGLAVEGVGTIRFPLSERDAQAIISVARPIRVSEEEDVGGAWEIEAASIDLQNANWDTYLATNAILAACETLGVGQMTAVKPQCELVKLVLLGVSDSQFILRQEGFRADGIFATVAVILSSSFEGGQVHISHGDEEVLIDISQDSAFGTSILAWYNEATHTIFPVKSGYRLALIYNLIHPFDSPQPSLDYPSIDPSDSLPRIFHKWKNGRYRQIPSSRVLACPLSYTYREPDLKHGVSILEGSDLEKVEFVLPLAEKYGFTVCLANLESNTPAYTSLLESESRGYSIFNVVCISEPDRKLYFGDLDIYDDSVVFDKDAAPRPMVSGRLPQRTVLLIFRHTDEPCLVISSQGIDQAMRKIKRDPDTSTAKQMAYAVLINLRHVKSEVGDSLCDEQLRILAARDLMDLATGWREAALWTGAFPYSGGTLKHICNELRKALHVFHVKTIHDSIADLLRRTPELQSCIRIVEVVVPFLSDEVGPRWADYAMGFVLSLYQAANIDDIPILFELARQRVIPNILHRPNICSFFVALVDGLHQNRGLFLSSTSSSQSGAMGSEVQPSVECVVRQSLNAMISTSGLAQPQRDTQCIDLDGIFSMVDFCFAVGDVEPTSPLFDAILRYTSGLEPEDAFDKVFTYAISRLKLLFRKYGVYRAAYEPFGPFLREVISLYMAHILPSTRDVPTPKWPKVGCGCEECGSLDSFVNNPGQVSHSFTVKEDRRLHLENRIREGEGSTFLSYHGQRGRKRRSAHTLTVSKRPEAIAENVRKQKQDAAHLFLKSIGNDGSLVEAERVMGKRWCDVWNACEGKAPFQASVVGNGEVKVQVEAEVNATTGSSVQATVKQEVKEDSS